MIERRKLRSTNPTKAMELLLEAERHRVKSDAIAVTTSNGTLIAGVGKGVDVEWLGQLGASRRQASFEWDDRAAHVELMQVGTVPLVLTSVGQPVDAAHLAGGLSRILEA